MNSENSEKAHEANEAGLVESKKRSMFFLWRSEFGKKLIGTLAALAVAGLLFFVSGLGTFVLQASQKSLDDVIKPYVLEIVLSDIKSQAGHLSDEINMRIASQIDSTTGSVVAGTMNLSHGANRQAVAFYLPQGHRVDIELEVVGLEFDEKLKITSNFPQDVNREIRGDGVYILEDLKQPKIERNSATDVAMPVPRRVQGPTKDFFPIVLTLSKSEDFIASENLDGADTALQSLVTVKYVGLMSPPVKIAN